MMRDGHDQASTRGCGVNPVDAAQVAGAGRLPATGAEA